MWGFTITLANGTEVPGVIFPDGGVYVHEPIADSYGRMSDLLDAHTVKRFAVIGPVVPLEACKKQVEVEYERAIGDLDAATREVKRRYRESKKMLAEYSNYNPETGILTIQDPEEPAYGLHIELDGKPIAEAAIKPEAA